MKVSKTPAAPVRVAVVGLGYIAQNAMLPAFAHARDHCTLTALVSGNATKRRTLARRYRVASTWSYDGFDEALDSDTFDAVYLALPNHLHRDFAERSARAGKHVLCEKPMALSERDGRSMIRTAADHGVRLMVAYRLHFDPANLDVVEIARSRRIGDLQSFEAQFATPVRPGDIRTRRRTGGGTLWDIGIYCINAARYLFRAEPTEAFAWTASRPRPRFREVEETAVASLRFSGGRLATFWTSFTGPELATFSLVGSKGHVRLDQAFGYHEPRTLTLTVGNRTTRRTYPAHDQFAAELVHFANSVRRGTRPSPSGEEGLADVAIIRALYRSAEIGRPVGLESHAPPSRPRPEQSTKRPAPARKPGLVQVVPPHPS